MSQTNQHYSSTNSGKTIGVVAAAIVIPTLIIGAAVLYFFVLPAVRMSREAAEAARNAAAEAELHLQCTANLKMIALAMHNYEDTYKRFPPAYTVDANGKRLHSWRTLLLPYLQQSDLYKKIDLNKPWDDPVNQVPGEVVVPVYACPAGHIDAPMKTCYQVVVDPTGIFSGAEGTSLGTITDGTQYSLLLFESSVENAVPWMSPQDSDLPAYLAFLADPNRHIHSEGTNIALGSGEVRVLPNGTAQETAKAIVTKGGGEVVEDF